MTQALNYPLLADARISVLRQYAPMTESELVEAIRAAAKEQKISQTDLAKIAGLPSQSAMSNIFKGKRRLTIEEAEKLTVFLGIENGREQVQWIAVIGLASAGNWNEAIHMPIRHFPMPPRIAGPRAFAVEIKGDSMNMLLPEGGWAVVDPDQRELYNMRVYLIQNGEHEVTVKRYRNDPARFEPVSTNDLHQPILMVQDSIRVVGRIVSYGNDQGL